MSTPVDQWLVDMDITAGRLEWMRQLSAGARTVTNFGALGDGATDDAPAIQDALDWARDSGGGWVIVPPGVYLLTSLPLRIYGNTRLTLLPGAEFRRNADARMMTNGDAGQSYGGYTGHSKILIEGGLWNMRGTTTGLTNSAMCISIGHASDITIRDLEVRDVSGYHAIEMNSTKRGIIQNCSFRGFVDPGGRDISEAVQPDLAKSVAEFGAFGPYDHTPVEDLLVQGCYFGASGTAGTTAWPRGIGSHSTTITKWHRRIRIIGCTFEGLLQFAISGYNWEDVVVSGNTFSGCGSGARFRVVSTADTEDTKLPDGTQTSASQDMRNISITGNTFRDGAAYGQPVILQGEATGSILNVTVAGNTIDDTSGQTGIRAQYVSRIVIADNVVANIDATAISTENANNLVINGNMVWTPAGHGITIVSSTHASATNNQVRDAGQNGILVQDSSDIHLRNNYIKSPGRLTNATYYGIRLSSNVSSCSVSGNKCRPNGSGNEALNGYAATSTCTLVHRYGNDWRGSTWTTGSAVADTSTSGSTLATDLT